jgi:hypothetical protein
MDLEAILEDMDRIATGGVGVLESGSSFISEDEINEILSIEAERVKQERQEKNQSKKHKLLSTELDGDYWAPSPGGRRARRPVVPLPAPPPFQVKKQKQKKKKKEGKDSAKVPEPVVAHRKSAVKTPILKSVAKPTVVNAGNLFVLKKERKFF